MRAKSLYTVLLAISVLLSSGMTSARETYSPSPFEQQAVVYFVEPVPVETAFTEAASYGVYVVELLHSNHVLEQDVQGGYFPDPTLSPEENAKRYELVYAQSLKNLLNEAEEAYAHEADTQIKTAWQRHIFVLDSALAQLQDEGLRVVSMVVQGKPKALNEFNIRSGKVERLEIVPQHRDNEALGDGQILWVNPNTWLPNRGRTIVRPGNSQDTERYVHQAMIWTDVSGFGSNSTYEHDFYLYNYDGKTYLSRDQWPNGIPRVIYWGSNLPRAYLDTRLGDPSGEVAYVIGCADGDAIQANTWYWSQIRTKPGDANTDKAKLFGQLGHRSPSSCYSTWCVFADQTEPVVGSWNNPWAISVPVDLWWSR